MTVFVKTRVQNMSFRSRGALRPSDARTLCPSDQRGRRECRMRVAPVAACATKKHRRQQLQVHRNSRHSLRNGFNGVLRALPGDRAFLPPSSVGRTTNLAPVSGRQNHTTSPSAKALFVRAMIALQRSRVHRIPFPTSVTIASRPSSGERDAQMVRLIWG